MSAEVLDWGACELWIRTRQAKGQRVVFTNGCFDLLHAGHIHLLEEAARLGDYLVVAINSDESVRRLKGPQRPIMPLTDRLALMSALQVVDVLVVFPAETQTDNEAESDLWDTPHTLLQRLRPDILVKGGDYAPDGVVGREFVEEVHIVPLLAGRSTSDLIQLLGASP